tara:strand:- start:494 stop:1099 length:606 start_codon:yes stop_codon:yes gene_type:complete
MKIITNIVILIAIILILPVDGIAGHHRYNTCVDFDSLIDSAGNYQENNGNYMNLDLYEGYFYVCKIGYIEGEVTLGWDVKNSINANISIIVLNNNNLNNFISGNSYGHSNMDLAELYLDWGPIAQFNKANSDSSESRHTTTELIGDNYYLVINFGYRTTFHKEEVNQNNIFDNLKYYNSLTNERDLTFGSAYVTASIDIDY